MMKRTLTLAVTFICFSFVLLFGETAEDKLLSKTRKLKTYYLQARSAGRTQKLELIERILGEFDDMSYSSDDRTLVEIAEYLSEEGSTRKVFEENRLINDFPEVRRASVMLLEQVGGDRARDVLTNVLINDQNTTVKTQACQALASENIGDNSNGDVLRALIYVYRSTYNPEPKFVYAIISAIKNIAKSNSANYSDAIYILSEIQLGNYNRKIREEAYNAIVELSN